MYIRQNYWEYYFLTGAVHYGKVREEYEGMEYELWLYASEYRTLKSVHLTYLKLLYTCVSCIPPEDHTIPHRPPASRSAERFEGG